LLDGDRLGDRVDSHRVPGRGPNEPRVAVVVDVETQRLVATLPLAPKAMPQDIKIAPDGGVWYVADMATNGVCLIDGTSFRKVGFVPTGKGAHGLYPSRDAKILYVINRGEGSISRISFRHATGRRQVAHSGRRQPRHGRPECGGNRFMGVGAL